MLGVCVWECAIEATHTFIRGPEDDTLRDLMAPVVQQYVEGVREGGQQFSEGSNPN